MAESRQTVGIANGSIFDALELVCLLPKGRKKSEIGNKIESSKKKGQKKTPKLRSFGVEYGVLRGASERVAEGEEHLMALVADLHGVADVVVEGRLVVDIVHEG